MANLVLVFEADRESVYSASHIYYLLRKGLVKGDKRGGTWFVDLDDLKRYEREMEQLGDQKFDPTRGREKS